MPTVKFEELYKADIIFTTSQDSAISKTIRTATRSIISHSMLVTSQTTVIDSTNIGVKERPWSDAQGGATLAIVMRRGGLLNGADQDRVIAAARSFENRPYDYLGAAGAGMGDTRNKLSQVRAVRFCPSAAPLLLIRSRKMRNPKAPIMRFSVRSLFRAHLQQPVFRFCLVRQLTTIRRWFIFHQI